MKLLPKTLDEKVLMLLVVLPVTATFLALFGRPWPALYLMAVAFLTVVCWIRRDPPWALMRRMLMVALRRERQQQPMGAQMQQKR